MPPSGAGFYHVASPPSSEAEIRSRAAGDGRLMGHGGCWAAADRGPFHVRAVVGLGDFIAVCVNF
jgi:hypothetical protein